MPQSWPRPYALGILQSDDAIGAHRSRCRRRTGTTLAFAWRELFNPLGMRNVTLSSTPRARRRARPTCWQARLGEIRPVYLNDGIVGGKRLLHEDWVDFAAATLDTDYAAGFWTNRSEHPNAKGRVRLGIPRDAFRRATSANAS
jgi:CubicO group peptidase (beta-lactamase class C family)